MGTYDALGPEIKAAVDQIKQNSQPAMTDHAQRQTHEEFVYQMAEYRGVERESICGECNGCGVKAYASTATWRGGIGGQTITNAVCDVCWGSGDKHRAWDDLRKIESRVSQAHAEGRRAGLEEAARIIGGYADVCQPGAMCERRSCLRVMETQLSAKAKEGV